MCKNWNNIDSFWYWINHNRPKKKKHEGFARKIAPPLVTGDIAQILSAANNYQKWRRNKLLLEIWWDLCLFLDIKFITQAKSCERHSCFKKTVATSRPLLTLDRTNPNLKLFPENFHLFDAPCGLLHLKIHHSAPRGIGFTGLETRQPKGSRTSYGPSSQKRGDDVPSSCKCSWHVTAFHFTHDEESCSRDGGGCSDTALKWWRRLDWEDWGWGFAQERQAIWFTARSVWRNLIGQLAQGDISAVFLCLINRCLHKKITYTYRSFLLKVSQKARYQNRSYRMILWTGNWCFQLVYPGHFKKNEALISNNEVLCLKC